MKVEPTQPEKVLLALYRSKKGLTWGMVSRIKSLTLSAVYQILMKLKKQGFAVRQFSAQRGKYKSYRFFISQNGIKLLRDKGFLGEAGHSLPQKIVKERTNEIGSEII